VYPGLVKLVRRLAKNATSLGSHGGNLTGRNVPESSAAIGATLGPCIAQVLVRQLIKPLLLLGLLVAQAEASRPEIVAKLTGVRAATAAAAATWPIPDSCRITRVREGQRRWGYHQDLPRAQLAGPGTKVGWALGEP
jgi:hypothetical protein